MRVLAAHEYDGIVVTQFHYFFALDGQRFEGMTISAEKDGFWKNEWLLEYMGDADTQYDNFSAFIPDRERFYFFDYGAVIARDIVTGKAIWRLSLDGHPRKGVVDLEGNLYVTCTETPLIIAISHEGELLWQYRDVLDHTEAWDFRLIENEVMVKGDDEFGEHLIYFDRDGNYRVEEIRPSMFD